MIAAMASSFLLSWAREAIFFSGDVKTTTIALAITSSLCCSIVVWLIHMIGGTDSRKTKQPEWHSAHPILRRSSSAGKANSNSGPRYHRQLVRHFSSSQTFCSKCIVRCSSNDCLFKMCSNCCWDVRCSCHSYRLTRDLDTNKHRPEEVNLSYVGLESWPERLGYFGTQLHTLDLSHNHLKSVPDELGCLLGLKELHLQFNRLTSIPESIRNLSKLMDFDLSYNCLSKMPDISCLLELTRLNLSNNNLCTIPNDYLCHLNLLEDLFLGFNSLNTVPTELCALTKLKNLSLNKNPIKILPSSIGLLICLETLDVSDCLLTTLPPSIIKCKSLVSLSAANNEIHCLPNLLGNLKCLAYLEVSNNRLPCLPYTLRNLVLTKLKVDGNPLLTKSGRNHLLSSRKQFPSLSEISASAATRAPWRMLQELPYSLREMLVHPMTCSNCGQRLFMQYETLIQFVDLSELDQALPLSRVICSNGHCMVKHMENTE